MVRPRIPKPPARRPAGYSLVEVLVALLVLSIGLLGLGFLQAQGMRFNTESYMRTQATAIAYDILDRMRLNPDAVLTGGYDVPTSSAAASALSAYKDCKAGGCACATSSCTTSTLATHDLGIWLESQAGDRANGLPPALTVDTNNYSTITRSVASNVTTMTVTMRWVELRRDTNEALPITQAWQAVIVR